MILVPVTTYTRATPLFKHFSFDSSAFDEAMVYPHVGDRIGERLLLLLFIGSLLAVAQARIASTIL